MIDQISRLRAAARIVLTLLEEKPASENLRCLIAELFDECLEVLEQRQREHAKRVRNGRLGMQIRQAKAQCTGGRRAQPK